jgi:hypothetical protein
LQLAEALQKDPTQFADVVAAIPTAFEHILMVRLLDETPAVLQLCADILDGIGSPARAERHTCTLATLCS